MSISGRMAGVFERPIQFLIHQLQEMPLRRRLATTLIALPVALGGVFSLLVSFSYTHIEQTEIERLLERELDFYLALNLRPSDIDSRTATLSFFRSYLPPELADLPPGPHRLVRIGNNAYQVLIRQLPDGERVAVTYDMEILLSRINRVRLMMLLVVLGSAAMTWLLAGILARYAVKPLELLLEQIQALNPETRGERLSTVAPDEALQVIVSALNDYMGRLDAVVERERAFASAASHELRTPLAVITGAVDILEQAEAAPPRILGRIRRASEQARRDLDALLALSRTREPPESRHLSLDTWLPATAESYLTLAADTGTQVDWHMQAGASVVAPPGALEVIFTNLLRNAIKASPGGTVTVEVSDQRVRIVDTGGGVPEDLLPTIFEPGTRGSTGGSGMGLYIARSLAQRLGWRLTLGNHANGGACAELHFSCESGD